MKLEVFKRKDKYIVRILTFNETDTGHKTKVIEETNIAKLTIKLQDEFIEYFKNEDSNSSFK